MKWIIQNNLHVLKKSRSIVGYVNKGSNGHQYNIGKPSDTTVATFSSSGQPFTLEQAKERLYKAVNY